MKITGSSIQQLDKLRANGTPKPKSECRKWRLWVTTEDGRKSRRVEGSYSKASKALSEFISELEKQVPNPDTFGAYAASWQLWREKSGNFSPNTVSKDKRNVKALTRSPLGEQRMDSITPDKCREALLWMKENPASGKPLSNTSLRALYVAMNSIFIQAEDDGKIALNPCRKIDPPKEDTREKKALSPEELTLFLNRLDELPIDAHVMALYLMACLGLRRGEALALMDSDVSHGMARVRYSVKESNGSIAEPKSKSGVRTIPLPPRLEAKIEAWRAARRASGMESAPTLCPSEKGGVMRPQNLYKWWRKVAPSLGCEGVTLHQFRHSNLSMMARFMSPFDLQRYAGWSSIEPAKVYIHDDLDAMASAVGNAWSVIGCTKNAPIEEKGQRTSR